MRCFVLVLSLALSVAAPAFGALGQARPEGKPDGKPAEASRIKRPPPTLDDLFSRLAAAKDEAEATGIANLIERRWSRSGSDTADLLMTRAGEALKGKDFPLAIELLDRTLTLRPDWAEAWNRRATAFFLLDDPVSAIADIERVVAKEPRHFGAWAGLGHIYMSNGDKKRALEAYRKALAIHPYLPKLKELVERLAPEIDGRDI
jgi:tetratricopeptide (TPR) repeat protein